MKRALVSAAAAVLCMAGMARAADFSLSQGQVYSRKAGNVKIH